MAINPLEALIENTSTISDDLSPAKAAYILSQIFEKIGYDEQPTENAVEEVSPSEQEDAIKTLSEIISGVHSGKSYEEAIVTAFEVEELVEEVEQTVVVLPLAEDRLAVATDVIEEVLTLSEEKISVNHSQQNIEDIHRYVIPLVLSRLMKEGSTIESEDGEGKYIHYQSEKFTVTLNVSPGGEQLLTLDRNVFLENESARALEATKESQRLKFEILINNFTQQELDKIKAIAIQEAQKASHRNSQQGEIGD